MPGLVNIEMSIVARVLLGTVACLGGCSMMAQTQYDLLLRGGRVVDPKNHLSAVRDIAVRDGRIAAVSELVK